MKSAFLDPCDLRVEYDASGRTRFQLLAPFTYWSERLGREVTVPAGFVTDGPSIPAVTVPLVGSQTIGFRAAVVHDYLCRMAGFPRVDADHVFYEGLLACGVDEPVARTMYYGVALATAQNTPMPDDGLEFNA